tara:strand:+ start:25930 stop:26598 length:669 start_codon:yes stop_codon:yes gene_type:complete
MISFIVRTKNEERWIGHCIQSILNNFGREESDIIIIDNESTDETLQIVKMFKDCNLKVLTIPKMEYTPGKALNMGLLSASENSKYACITSAHCQIKDTDIKSLNNHMLDKKCFGIIGRQIPVYKGRKLKSKYVWENFSTHTREPIKNLIENDRENTLFFHNAFSFISLDAWRDHNFCEKISGKEDREWASRMSEIGFHSIYDPNQSCIHHWTHNCATWSGLG